MCKGVVEIQYPTYTAMWINHTAAIFRELKTLTH